MRDFTPQQQTGITRKLYFWLNLGSKRLPASQLISQARTHQQSDDAIGEGMKSWDEIPKAVNVTYEQT